MVVVMVPGASRAQVEKVVACVENAGLKAHLSFGDVRTIIGIIGDKTVMMGLPLAGMSGVEKLLTVTASYKLISREFAGRDHVVWVDGVPVGGGSMAVMAGPCAVESREQLMEAAAIVKAQGAQFLRGGAFKPRTSPYSFQGLEEKGLEYLAEAGEKYGLKVVTEIMDETHVGRVAETSHVLQVGARNMQNFALLRAVGRTGKPVLLKRGLAATIDEWLNAAEYIAKEGNMNIIMCERGIRTFETYTRNTLDLSAVVAVKELSCLPVIVDPSHGTGRRTMVEPMALAAVAAGADGLMVEVHPNPEIALSDGPQSLDEKGFAHLMKGVKVLTDHLRGQNQL